ncbi:hypothetical protein D7D52_13430 [Nocardia yunnanensis]|uniref:Uncharacterized protein n=1 Tax=Nocardia yunnanensis TaxID=2382165 RepID=A0A386ZA53_9NOCA|nr:hypothetical protein [Nocardia yunnanensis]AYF74702.1 hypothetical protein D7D52_13430 [Nocardia yunnanensis]
MHYVDLMTQATLLDHHVWTHPDTWNAALDSAARRSSRRGGFGFWGFAAVCCILIVAVVLGGVYLMTKRRNR